MLAARAAIQDLIPQWKKDWSVIVEPFDAALIDGTLAAIALRRPRRRRAGAADRVRQSRQPAARPWRRAPEGNRLAAALGATAAA
jgi:hypothetical protein